jgi:hypothetical protein
MALTEDESGEGEESDEPADDEPYPIRDAWHVSATTGFQGEGRSRRLCPAPRSPR